MALPTVIKNKVIKRASSTANSGAQTDTEVQAAVSGTRLRLVSVLFTSDAATDLLIEDGANKLLIRLENVTSALISPDMMAADAEPATAAGQSITYTTTAGDSSIFIEYTELSS